MELGNKFMLSRSGKFILGSRRVQITDKKQQNLKVILIDELKPI